MMKKFWLPAVLIGWVVSFGFAGHVFAEPDWSGWRGPTGDGHAQDDNLPVTWTEADIAWKTPLKGEGQSSACVWGERIFLTRSEDQGRRRFVFCVNRGDGDILWEKQVDWHGTPEPTHKMNGWASASCTTDGELVFAFFGKAGLYCYTVKGVLVWEKKRPGRVRRTVGRRRHAGVV